MKQKDMYIQKIEEQIQGWKVDIDRLRAMAENAEAHLRTEYHKKLDILKEKQAAAESGLTELKEASEESWEDFKKGYEEICDDLKESIASVQSSFK